jgi:hypothetical protein
MQLAAPHRWREVSDVWPDDYQAPILDIVRIDQSWKFTRSSLSGIVTGPVFSCMPANCKRHNWLLGTDNAVCSKCGSIIPRGDIENADQLTADYVLWIERRMDILPPMIHRLEALLEDHTIIIGGGTIGKPYPFRMYAAARNGVFVRTEVLETVLELEPHSLDNVRSYQQLYHRAYVSMRCRRTGRFVARDGDTIPAKYRDYYRMEEDIARWKVRMPGMMLEHLRTDSRRISKFATENQLDAIPKPVDEIRKQVAEWKARLYDRSTPQSSVRQ